MFHKRIRMILLVASALLSISASANAALVFDLDTSIGGYTPVGTAPWATATFEDVAGGVKLTLSANWSTSSDRNQRVNAWYFNLSGIKPPDFIMSIDAANSQASASVGYNSNNFATHNNYATRFDIMLSFTGSGNSGFTGGEKVIFNITGTGVDSSLFYIRNNDNLGLYFSAADIEKIGTAGNDKGTIATPIPAAAWMLGAGLIGLVTVRRRTK